MAWIKGYQPDHATRARAVELLETLDAALIKEIHRELDARRMRAYNAQKAEQAAKEAK